MPMETQSFTLFPRLPSEESVRTSARIWFNFNHDILYLPQHRPSLRSTLEKDISYRATISSRPVFFVERISPADLARVRRLALDVNHLWTPTFLGIEPRFLGARESLEELLTVETHCGSRNLFYNQLSDRRDDFWGYVECDVPEATGKCGKGGAFLASHYCGDIRRYKREHRNDGRGFFDQLALSARRKLSVDIDGSIFKLREESSTPTVKFVQVMTRSSPQRLVRKREEYWEQMR